MIQDAINNIKSSFGAGKYTLDELAIKFGVDKYMLAITLSYNNINPSEIELDGSFYSIYDIGDLSIIDQSTVNSPDASQVYYDVFKGRQKVRRNIWYGPKRRYGEGYFQADENYRSTSYTNVPSFDYRTTGSRPNRNGKLLGVCVSFTESTRDIDNLHILINKQTKTNGSTSVSNTVIYHEDTVGEGHSINNDRPYMFEIDLDVSVSVNDVITLVMNSSDSSNSTTYLDGLEIKYIYE